MMRYALYNLDYLTGPYAEVSDVARVKRYVHAGTKQEEPCEFPNIVYRGWCTCGSERWQTEFCRWKPEMWEEWFGTWGVGRLRFLRWEVRRGRYRDDLEGQR